MSAKTAKRSGAEAASSTTDAATAGAPKEVRAVIDSLCHAFRPKDQPGADQQHALPDVFRASGPPLVVRRLDGEISFANPAFKKLSGALTAARALASADDLAAVIGTPGQAYTEDLVVSLEGQPHFYLAWHDLISGAAPDSPCVLSCYLPADGAGRRLRALPDSDDRWRDFTRLVSDIVWECSPEAVFTYVSPRVFDLLGYHPHDVVGRPWSFLAGDRDKLTARLSDPHERAPFRGLELPLVDKAGRSRRFVVQGLPVFDRDSGALTGFRGTAEDINNHIEHEAALVEARNAADSANRAKSEFLANMSHELRTPLNAILGFTEMMAAEEFGPIGNERYHEYLNSVLESGRHLLNLINQVLDLAKIEAGRLQLIEDAVDPASLVRAAVRVVSANAKRQGIEIRTDVADSAVYLWADEGKLRQILLNLLSNSLKFTLEGGHVEISAKVDSNGTFVFRVCDTGIGIDQAQFAAVLTPFEQIDSALTRRFAGTGLGLPLSKALAEAHGGDLTLDSVLGVGTTITIRLPASRVRQD